MGFGLASLIDAVLLFILRFVFMGCTHPVIPGII